MHPITILEVPYHLGLRGVATGAGPGRILAAGADRVLAYRGVPAQVQHIDLRDKTCEGIDAIVDLGRQVRVAVREARQQEVLPVILAGNCITSIGILAGLEPGETGVIWLDAHPDFHTPQTSISGNIEGMSLATVAGHCHEDLRGRIGFSSPIPEHYIALITPRDVEDGERERLDSSRISIVPPEVPLSYDSAAEQIYLHIDLDVLALEEGPGVAYRAGGGLPVESACALVRHIMATKPVAAVALTNYRPDLDEQDKMLNAALKLLKAIAS
ncbi:MAG: arginase family protein [Bryobacterales bacterium]|nr:arginase family protein [Bryobacterales bacterium]